MLTTNISLTQGENTSRSGFEAGAGAEATPAGVIGVAGIAISIGNNNCSRVRGNILTSGSTCAKGGPQVEGEKMHQFRH